MGVGDTNVTNITSKKVLFFLYVYSIIRVGGYKIKERKEDKMKRQDKYPNTETFIYENVNPKKRITGDCEMRAIAKASGLSWEKVVMGLAEIGVETGFCPFVPKAYGLYLERLGFKKCGQPKHPGGRKLTLKEFIAGHLTGTYVVNLPGHVTTVIDGKVYDIWDCTRSSRRVGIYWEKGER